MVTGDGAAVSEVALPHPDLAGIHFTGSTGTFQHLWRTVGENIAGLSQLPAAGRRDRRQGLRHRAPVRRPGRAGDRAGPGRLRVPGPEVLGGLARATFRAASGTGSKDQLIGTTESLTMGDVSADLSLFMGAVIDERAFGRHRDALARAGTAAAVSLLTGGGTDDSVGYFVQPTVLASSDPTDEIFTREYFGPILGVHVFEDRDYGRGGPGRRHRAVCADRLDHRQDRAAIAEATADAAVLGRATSTSTTSPPGPSWGSSRSAAPAPAAPTTRPARSST